MTRAEQLFFKYQTYFLKNGFVTPQRLACFFGRAVAEVGEALLPKRESGYYTTVKRARDTFKTPFQGRADAFVKQYLNNSKKMLNYVYANRMGNRGESSGDGYRNRGGGIFQITGRHNLEKLSRDTGVDFIGNPDLLMEEFNSIVAAVWFWNSKKLNQYADIMDIDSIADIINIGKLTIKEGDAHGYIEQKEATEKFLKIFSKYDLKKSLKNQTL